jgi:Zn-dependent oligopeptidase
VGKEYIKTWHKKETRTQSVATSRICFQKMARKAFSQRNGYQQSKRKEGGNYNMPQEYPYAQQEAQLLAQISARRKAYMQRYGRAEQQFTGNASGANLLGDTYNDPGTGDDLFKGNILD